MSENLGTLTAYLGLNISALTAGLANARAAMKRTGAQMRTIGKNMTMKLSAPIVALGILFAKTAVDFQTSMRKINTLVGLGVDRLNEMSKGVISLSNETGRSSVELADALFVVTSAGQRGAEAMQILERSAKASAIGLGETKEVARTVTAVLNAYGKENISAARATDILVGIVREGNLVAEEISPVLGRVMGIASQLGISFAEVGGSIATFTRLGVKADEAVTGLRGIMNALLKPTDQSKAALQSIGLTMEQLKRKIRKKGLADALIDLVSKFEGNEEALSDLVPNVRALSAVLGTAGPQADAYAEIMGKLNGELNHVDKGFKLISEDAGFQFEKTMQQLKNAALELGMILLPTVNKILKAVTGLVKKFTSLSGSTKTLTLVIAGLVAGLGPAIYIIGTITTVFATLASGVGAVIAGIVALSAVVLYLWDNWEAVIERISDWDWWKNMLINMAQFLLKWNPASLLIKGFNALVKGVAPLWDKLVAKLTDVTWWKGMLLDMIKFFLKWNPFNLMWEGIQKITGADWGNLFSGLDEQIDKLQEGLDPKNYNTEAIVDPFAIMSDTLEGLKTETKEYTTEFKSFGKTVDSIGNKIKAVFGITGGAGGILPSQDRVKGDPNAITAIAPKSDLFGDSFNVLLFQTRSGLEQLGLRLRDTQNGFDQQTESMRTMGEASVELGTAIQNALNSAFVELGETLGNLFSGDAGAGDFFQGLLGIVASFMATLGKALIAVGIASEAFKNLLSFGGGLGAIAAGVALIALAGVVKNLMSKGPSPQGLASGGFITGGGVFQLHRDELVTLPNGSAVTPANMARGGGRLTAVVSGSDLKFILDEEDRKTGNTF